MAVAAYQIDTIPGRTLLLIRAGGEQDWSENVLIYNVAVANYLGSLWKKRREMKNYLLVGCWEKTRVASVHELKLKNKEISRWLNRPVGCPVHNLAEEWWRKLEDQEVPSAHG